MQNKKIILPEIYNFLCPKQTKNLARFGVKKDGGYIVEMTAVNRVNHLISFGMADEYSFEIDFLKNNKDNTLEIYDFTVNHKRYIKNILKVFRRFLTFRKNFEQLVFSIKNYYNFLKFISNKKVKFYSKKITDKSHNDNEQSLQNILNNLEVYIKSVGWKIDIEGDEYKLVNDIISNSNKINFLIIEFHFIEKNTKIFINNIKEINNFFDIIHIHGNNHEKVLNDGLPNVLEITFANKKNKLEYVSYPKNFPIKNLDYPNNPFESDININFS